MQKRPNSSKYCTKKKILRKRKRERFEKLYKIVQAVEKRKRKNKNLLAKKKVCFCLIFNKFEKWLSIL